MRNSVQEGIIVWQAKPEAALCLRGEGFLGRACACLRQESRMTSSAWRRVEMMSPWQARSMHVSVVYWHSYRHLSLGVVEIITAMGKTGRRAKTQMQALYTVHHHVTITNGGREHHHHHHCHGRWTHCSAFGTRGAVPSSREAKATILRLTFLPIPLDISHCRVGAMKPVFSLAPSLISSLAYTTSHRVPPELWPHSPRQPSLRAHEFIPTP